MALIKRDETQIINLSTDLSTLQTEINIIEQAELAELADNPSHITVVNNTNNNILFGQPVYIVSDNGNLAVVALADATDILKKDVIGVISDTVILANGGTGKVALYGKITGTAQQWAVVTNTVNGLVANTKYFLDIVTGILSPTIPVSDGQYCCLVGKSLSTTDFVIKIEQPIKL